MTLFCHTPVYIKHFTKLYAVEMSRIFQKSALAVALVVIFGKPILGINCPLLNSPHHGNLSYSTDKNISDCEYPVGTIANVKCNEFYVTEGNYSSECLHDGKWNSSGLTCRPACGKSNEMMPLIVHGHVASHGFFPWNVAIYNKPEKELEFWCSGTLISDKVVLTAAHCTWKVKVQNLKLAFGKFHRDLKIKDDNSQIVHVERIETLSSYQDASGNYNGDISVIFLETAVEINNFVRPACIDWDQDYMDDQLKEGNFGMVMGWGLTENDTLSDQLRFVKLPVVSDEHCIKQQRNIFRKFITYTTFCAGFNNGTGVCNGDSGSGLFFYDKNSDRWFIQGLVSVSPRRKGTSYCDPHFATVFTKLNMFTRWLKSLNIFENENSTDDYKNCRLKELNKKEEGKKEK